jgi:integrase
MSLRVVRRPWSPYWVIRGTVRGSRIEESAGTNDKKTAQEICAKREADELAAAIWGRSATATFAHAAASYLEATRNKRFLQPIIKHFGTTSLAQIGQEAIDRMARKLYPNASDATRNRQAYTPASAVMRHAAGLGWCPVPILKRPNTSPRGEPRWLTREEAERLINACSAHLRPLVTFLIYTGARAGEALWLDWRSVDLVRGHVTFSETKNGDARGVTLVERVVAELANLPHRQDEVFRRPDGLPYERPDPENDDDHSAGTRIKTAFKGACRRAGIENFHPHDCRHTFATWHYAQNRNLGALQRLGGWKSVKMVMRYAHTNVGDLADTMHRLPGATGGNLGGEENSEVKSA